MKILIEDNDSDPVQIQIDKVQRAIKVYNSYLEYWYDDGTSLQERINLHKKIEKEVNNLDLLKSRHPEYFI